MIRIYTVPGCEDCKNARDHLEELKQEFEEVNLKEKENREAREYYRSLGIKTAPVIVDIIDGHVAWIMEKYDRDELNKMIKMNSRLSKSDVEKIKERLRDLNYL